MPTILMRTQIDDLLGPDPDEGFGGEPGPAGHGLQWMFDRYKVDHSDRADLIEHSRGWFVFNPVRNRVRFFSIRIEWFSMTDGSTIRVRTPSLSLYFRGELLHLKYREGHRSSEAIRRELAEAKERAEDRNLSAIERGLALESLTALVDLSASLATTTIAPPPPPEQPYLLTAGGQTSTFAPLT